MVKITEPLQHAGRAVGDRESIRMSTRSHHNWGARLSRRRHETALNPEPRGLLDLEDQARRAVMLMERHSPKSDYNYDRAMELLRLQYNMNFIVLCEKCCGPHVIDEILAPER